MLDTKLTPSRGMAVLTTIALLAMAGCGPNSSLPTTSGATSADAGVLTLVLSTTSPTFVQVPDGPLPAPQVIIASNAAALIPSTGIQVGPTVYTDNLHGGWLSVTPKILGLTASITMRVTRNDLPLGAYTATFTVKVPGTNNSPLPVRVTFVNGWYFADGLETGTGWSYTGLWNRSMLGGDICTPPVPYDEGGYPEGCLPNPDEGSWALWYGNPETGNYDTPGVPNSGDATSPEFTIPSGAVDPVLKFRTWYETEYLDAPFDFDFMDVYLVDADTENRYFIGELNSMVGFTGNQTSGYVTIAMDLSGYTGHNWRLQFEFNTGDPGDNAHRGWIVDRIVVAEPGYFTPSDYPALRTADGPQVFTLGPKLPRGAPRSSQH